MRLPFQPLFDHAGLSLRQFLDTTRSFTGDIKRAQANGLSVKTADLWSVRLGFHPVEAYGIDTWISALEGGRK